ncbi:MAG: hypothetical protein K5669_04345 [Lachnospiraceae bacterium]|nr:hypothetical protein [Lachnospiraceae bacterium]
MKNMDFYLEDEIKELNSEAKELELKIDGLLTEGTKESYETVLKYMFDSNNDSLFRVSRSLNVLRLLSEAEKKQLDKGLDVTIFTGRDLRGLEELYQELVFRLRRVEFDKPISVKDDILQFLVDNHLSLDILVVVIQGTIYLYNKDKIWKAITESAKNG